MSDNLLKLHDQQKGIKIGPKEPCDNKNIYQRTNLISRDMAMENLDGNCYKLWSYLQGHAEGYTFGLSPKELDKRGLKKHPYLRAVGILIEKGYLMPDEIKPGIQGYLFIEKPVDNFNRSGIGIKNDLILSESIIPVKIMTQPGSQNDPIPVDNFNPYRSKILTTNITNTIEYNKDTTGSLSEEEREEANKKIDELITLDNTFKNLLLEMKQVLNERELFNWVINR